MSEELKMEETCDRNPLSCRVCGAFARRIGARFCANCGRAFVSAQYTPAESLRDSYNTPDRRIARASSQMRLANHTLFAPREKPLPRIPSPIKNMNGASTTALAFVVYSLVPYLGILFCPGAIVVGFIGLARLRRRPQIGGRRSAAFAVGLGFVTLGAQIFLWWMLYRIPEWVIGF